MTSTERPRSPDLAKRKREEVRYKRGQNPRSLANLTPIKRGQVLNPEGRNGSEREREGWEIAVALVRAVQVEPDEERRVELLSHFARRCFELGVAGDRRVMAHLIQILWPVE